MLRTADTNGDGKISKTEFLEYVLQDEELDENGDYEDKEHEETLQAQLQNASSRTAALQVVRWPTATFYNGESQLQM